MDLEVGMQPDVERPGRLLTIGELAQRTGVAASALRYYEELGLLTPATRVSGRRRYRQAAVERVGTILLFRDIGFTLAETKALLATRSVSRDAWRALARRKLAELDEQAARIEAARVALDHALRCRHRELSTCANFGSALDARLRGEPLEQAHRH